MTFRSLSSKYGYKGFYYPRSASISSWQGVFHELFYTKCTVLKAPCAMPERDLCGSHYIGLSVKYGNKTSMISAPTRQVYVIYAYENQGLFLNIVDTRKMCSSKFSFEKPLLDAHAMYASYIKISRWGTGIN